MIIDAAKLLPPVVAKWVDRETPTQQGRPAYHPKLSNNLVDKGLLIVCGSAPAYRLILLFAACAPLLIPNLEGIEGRFQSAAFVDRYLEHDRAYF